MNLDSPESVLDNSDGANSVKVLTYPLSGDSIFSRFSITFRDYEFKYKKDPTNTPELIIALPLPGVSSSFSQNYDNVELGVVTGSVIGESGGFNRLKSVLARASANLIQSNIGLPVADAASIAIGNVINPFSEVIYRTPNFRSFHFDWLLVPKNAKERDEIDKIIDEIKFRSSPYFIDDSRGILGYPDIVSIDTGYPTKINRGVITDFTSSWNEGEPIYIQDDEKKSPLSVRISMQVLETEILVRNSRGEKVFRTNGKTTDIQ